MPGCPAHSMMAGPARPLAPSSSASPAEQETDALTQEANRLNILLTSTVHPSLNPCSFHLSSRKTKYNRRKSGSTPKSPIWLTFLYTPSFNIKSSIHHPSLAKITDCSRSANCVDLGLGQVSKHGVHMPYGAGGVEVLSGGGGTTIPWGLQRRQQPSNTHIVAYIQFTNTRRSSHELS